MVTTTPATCMSTQSTHTTDAAKGKDTTKAAFVAVFDTLAQDILKDMEETYGIPKEGIAWVKKALYHNVPGGKMNRGLSVIESFELLTNGTPTEEHRFQAMVLGWCVEWLQAFFLVADDIMDQSKTRRGQPCWYLQQGVGNIAINDAFILESCIYKVLRKYFRHKPYYAALLELLHETTYQTELGQLMDLITVPDKVDFSTYTMDRYKLIVKYKTAYYSFYLPVAMAMLMSGITDDAAFQSARDILLPLGEFFQIQDDYLDCYGAPEVIGKIGTDIEENKCSWVCVTALSLVDAEQKALMEAHYGRHDAESVAKIKALYRSLDITSHYRQYEEARYQEILHMIEGVTVIDPAVFRAYAKRIFKRTL